MYDFCFTFPFAALLALGGLAGFAKGSLPSLFGGLGSAAVLAGCAQLSLSQYHKRKLCKPATALSGIVTASLLFVMWRRFADTGNFMPAGLLVILSGAMTAFYIWNIIFVTRVDIKKIRSAD